MSKAAAALSPCSLTLHSESIKHWPRLASGSSAPSGWLLSPFASQAARADSHLSAVATYDDNISVRREAPSLSLNSLAELKS